ncbi:MAG: type I secretion system permease/ATPase [Pseudomonadota bacterium]
MKNEIAPHGCQIRHALATSRSSFLMTAFFSCLINILMLAGPLYMLQIYDRVLASQSMPTLIALSLLITLLFLTMGLLDLVRSRILVRVGIRLDRDMGGPIFEALMRYGAHNASLRTDQPIRDLSKLRQFLTGQGPFAIFDAPWAPFYIIVVFLLDWVLGLVALGGSLAILTLAILNEMTTRHSVAQTAAAQIQSNAFVSASLRNIEAVKAMGMLPAIGNRWKAFHLNDLSNQVTSSDRSGFFSISTKSLRLFLQSAMLGTGAVLAIQNIITPGAMIAASILMGRALQPVEQAVSNWRNFQTTREAFGRLSRLLELQPEKTDRIELPSLSGRLTVESLSAGPPGVEKPFIRNVVFSLDKGQSLGIIGPSASGKSTLARVLVGIWPAIEGSVRIDDANILQLTDEATNREIGFLPQAVELFAGSVAENISRFDPAPNDSAVIKAAQLAGAHQMILRLPNGYETEIGESGLFLSAGQRQRIALARALYNDPVFVVLDEPNANLDADGDAALIAAMKQLKARGTTVVVISHRPGAISAMDSVLMMSDGKAVAFGPRVEVLGKVLLHPGADRQNTPNNDVAAR